MAYSLESAVIVPVTLAVVVLLAHQTFGAYQDVRKNALREAGERNSRILNEEIYRIHGQSETGASDIQTNPVALLRFCIYLEDQAVFLKEVFGDD